MVSTDGSVDRIRALAIADALELVEAADAAREARENERANRRNRAHLLVMAKSFVLLFVVNLVLVHTYPHLVPWSSMLLILANLFVAVRNLRNHF